MANLAIHTIPNQYTELTNSIAASPKGVLCAAWRGQDNDNIYLAFNTNQGGPNWTWDGVTTVKSDGTEVSTSHAPAVACFGNRLFIAWTNSSGQVVYTFSDDSGATFPYSVVLDNTNAKTAPALYGGKSLFISYTGTDNMIHVMSVG